jgi:drug/metabolite transporter (DMT)-like permease
VWSSGYIAGPYGVAAVSPLSLVAGRFVLAAILAGLLALALRRPLRVTRADAGRIALAGFMLNGVQFGAMYLAFDAGLGPTLASLMHSLSPVLTAVLAAVFLRERLSLRQMLGFVVGVVGVMLVLGPDIEGAGGAAGVVWGVIGVLGLSFGTLGQRWIGHAPDPYWSATIQFGVSAVPLILLAVTLEGTDVVSDPVAGVFALVYLAVVNSILGLALLGILVRARGAGAASSIFFLMPPVTALLAWLILGETLNLREVIGLVIAVVGVAVATRDRSKLSEDGVDGGQVPDLGGTHGSHHPRPAP